MQRFPRIDERGEFDVEVGFRLQSGDGRQVAQGIEAWVQHVWAPANREWTRHWRTGPDRSVEREETLTYLETFRTAPSVRWRDDGIIDIVLHGRDRKLWRDWLVWKFVPDLLDHFPELGERLYVRNESEGQRDLP